MGVLNLDDAKRAVGISSATDGEVETLETLIEAADQVIESIAGPVIPAVSMVTGRVLPSGAVALPVRLRSVVALSVDGGPVDVAAVDDSMAGVGVLQVKSGPPWRAGQMVTVTADTGPDETPAYVKLAAQQLIAHWWQLAQTEGKSLWVGGDGGFSPSSYAVPRRVRELLAAGDALPGFA